MEYVYNSTVHELKIPNIIDSQELYLFDEHGKRYMDLESGVWCISVGHKNARVNEAIKKQIDSVMHAGFCYSNQILEESAKSILAITNVKKGKCIFLCSGSEAIEVSRQISKHISGKRMSMTLHDSYLGAYSSVTDRDKDWYIFDWDQCKVCKKRDECDPNCEALKDIPENDFALDLTGWQLMHATAISDDGLTIAGYGINPNGSKEPWMATIPEPCSILLLSLGALALRRRRGRGTI